MNSLTRSRRAVLWRALILLMLISPPFGHAAEPAQAAQAPASGAAYLLFIDSAAGELIRYDPASGAREVISSAPGVNAFRLSPTQNRVAYGTADQQWLVRGIEAGKEFSLGTLAAPPIWSPDGSLLYLQLATGGVSVADRAGQVRRLAFDAGNVPRWSRDGSHLAWLDTGTLWVARLDAASQKVADGIGNFRWAPSGLRLAYETVSTVADPLSASQPEGRSTWVYDVAADSRTRVAEVGGLAGWTADGQGIDIIRLTGVGASGQSWTMLVASLDGSRLVEVGPGSTEPPDIPSPATIASTPDGQQVLLLEGGWLDDARKLYYENSQTHQQRLLFTQTGGLPHANDPGVWAALSPNGTWALVETVDRDDKYAVTLFRTDGSEQRQLGGAVTRPQDPRDFRLTQVGPHPFSSDERWLLDKDQQGWLLYDIRTDQSRRLAPAGSPLPIWLAVQAPVRIDSPETGQRLRSCEVTVSGTSTQAGRVSVSVRPQVPGSGIPAAVPGEILVVDAGMAEADGAWRSPPIALQPGDSIITATLLAGDRESAPSDPVHVVCGRPQATFVGDMRAIPTNSSGLSPIAFQFNWPMDSASINSQTVVLFSESFQTITGTITTTIDGPGALPTYRLQLASPLAPDTEYSLMLLNAIRAAAPDEDLRLSPVLWQLHTTGVSRDRIIAAMDDLARATSDKIEADVHTVSTVFADMYGIQADLEWADFGKSVLALMGVLVKSPRSIQQLLDNARQKPLLSKDLLVQFSALALELHLSGEDIALAPGNASNRAWIEAGLTEERLRLYEAALRQGQRPHLFTTELELLLRGTDRDSPLVIPTGIITQEGYQASGFTTGANVKMLGIRALARNVAERLPDPLPPELPTEQIYDELVRARSAIVQSQGREVLHTHVRPLYDKAAGRWTVTMGTARLGAIARDRQWSAAVLKDVERRNDLDMRLALYDAGSIGVAFMAQAAGSFTWQLLDWRLAPFEAGNLALNTVLSIAADPRDLVPQIPVVMLNDLPMEVFDVYRVSAEILEVIDRQARGELSAGPRRAPLSGLLAPKVAFAAEEELGEVLDVTDVRVEDAVYASGSLVTAARAGCVVSNRGRDPLRVRLRAAALPVGAAFGDVPGPLGYGENPGWVAVQPGKQATLEVAYPLLKPPTGSGLDLQVQLVVDAIAPGGRIHAVGPFGQFIRAGEKGEIDAMASLQAQPVLMGMLSAGEVQTATLNVPVGATLGLLLSHGGARPLLLSVQDSAGNELASDASGQAIVTSAEPGIRQVALPPGVSGPLTVAAYGLAGSRRGDVRYEVIALGLPPAGPAPTVAPPGTADGGQTAAGSPPPAGNPTPGPVSGDRSTSSVAGTLWAFVSRAWPFALGSVLLLVVVMLVVLGLRSRPGARRWRAWLAVGGNEIPVPQAGLTIGRDPANKVVVPHPLVSRTHAVIRPWQGACYIEDLDSTTGTFVNHRRITRAVLLDGDEIGIGETLMVFRMPGQRRVQ